MMRARAVLMCVAVAVAIGCEHAAPFPPTDYAPTDPFNPPPLTRLTLNPGEDRMPAWLPDGDIVFTAERADRADHDRCLAMMPAGGGAIRSYRCRTTASNDSIDVFWDVTATDRNGGQLAFVRTGAYRLPVLPVLPDEQAIVVAPLNDPAAARDVKNLPYFAPSRRTHWSVSHLRWLDDTRLIYVGDSVDYPRACSVCPPDTVRTGLELAVLVLAAPPAMPVVTVVPGTSGASSLAVGRASDTVYFTRENEAVVMRHILTSGVTDTVYDFGAGIARDVAWAQGRAFVSHDGSIYAIDLATGVPTLVLPVDSREYIRPAPSSDGRHLLVESQLPGGSLQDVWLVELP